MSSSSSSSHQDSGDTTTCPYAKSSASLSSLPGMIELQQCPAFSNSCPFKSASSPEEVTEQLQRIPIGHLKDSGVFFQTLKYFHETSASGGSCPVKGSAAVPTDWSFHQAMEELSLVSIMARLALAQEKKDMTEEESLTTSLDLPEVQTRSSLSAALKDGTAVAHEAAESVHFVKNFIKGKIDRDLYGLLVAQLFHLYNRLEQALDRHASQNFKDCHFPKELHRSEALKDDVEFWHTTTPEISPATQDYIDRINYLEKENPLLLLAHAYTRYLGDLSGGKILARVAKRALSLDSDDDGLAFYHFPHVQSFKVFKDTYRASLDALNFGDDQIQELVQEANVAFLLNMRLFEELDVAGGVPGATIRPLKQVYSSPRQTVSMNNRKTAENPSATCPFVVDKRQKKEPEAECPWPFVVLHDPITFLRSFKTWLLIGFILAFIYQSTIVAPTSPSFMASTNKVFTGEEQNLGAKKKVKAVFHYSQFYDDWQ